MDKRDGDEGSWRVRDPGDRIRCTEWTFGGEGGWPDAGLLLQVRLLFLAHRPYLTKLSRSCRKSSKNGKKEL